MTDYKLNLFEELSKLSQDYGEHGRALLLTFAEEAHGISGKIEQTLIGSEHDLSTLQRHIHTLKGSAGQAGLVSLGHMLHLIEGLLNPLLLN
jgi:chemotaxis protein histidine kinase CheA